MMMRKMMTICWVIWKGSDHYWILTTVLRRMSKNDQLVGDQVAPKSALPPRKLLMIPRFPRLAPPTTNQ
jgi:hypothetical protein